MKQKKGFKVAELFTVNQQLMQLFSLPISIWTMNTHLHTKIKFIKFKLIEIIKIDEHHHDEKKRRKFISHSCFSEWRMRKWIFSFHSSVVAVAVVLVSLQYFPTISCLLFDCGVAYIGRVCFVVWIDHEKMKKKKRKNWKLKFRCKQAEKNEKFNNVTKNPTHIILREKRGHGQTGFQMEQNYII